MSTIVKNFKPNNYNGDFESEINGYSINGSLNTNEDKTIQNFSGFIKKDELSMANFNAWLNGIKLMYNFSDISDLSQLSAISTAVQQVYEDINTEIHKN